MMRASGEKFCEWVSIFGLKRRFGDESISYRWRTCAAAAWILERHDAAFVFGAQGFIEVLIIWHFIMNGKRKVTK